MDEVVLWRGVRYEMSFVNVLPRKEVVVFYCVLQVSCGAAGVMLKLHTCLC